MALMDLVKRIDEEIEKRSLLKHPFYQMWSEGKLTIESLQGYSKEYFHLVKAVPEMVGNILEQTHDEEVLVNLMEEQEHIEPWVKFARGLGISREELEGYQVSQKTKDAVSNMLSLTLDIHGVASMYAYEAQLPEISMRKLEGLTKFYNITSDDATEYQRIHSVIDVKHAAVWRRLLSHMKSDLHDGALKAAISSLESQNKILDSVYETYIA